jgi:NAD(P)H-dependent FMN reductase
MTRIAIIIGSTRPRRRAELVARWVEEVATNHAARGSREATFEVIDLADYELPLLDEALPAAIGDYQHAHTKRWAETIASFDGFVFVTPEYNHSIPAALKNGIDFLFSEWNDKAAGFVSYGLNGGTRAVEHLRLVMAEVKVADVRAQVALSLFADFDITDMAEPGVFSPGEHQQPTLIRLLDEVCAWAQALQPLRNTAEADTATQRWRSSLEGRRVLVIGLSPKVNQSVVEPLQALGIAAEGFTQPEQASERFNANDFELIVFGRGALGPVSDQLKSEFTRQNPDVRFVDAIAPVAVKQTLAALAQDPQAPQLVTDFRLMDGDAGARIFATVLAPCHVMLTVYREIGDGVLEAEVLADVDAEPGPFEQQSDVNHLADANSLLLTANEEEYHLHPLLGTH